METGKEHVTLLDIVQPPKHNFHYENERKETSFVCLKHCSLIVLAHSPRRGPLGAGEGENYANLLDRHRPNLPHCP